MYTNNIKAKVGISEGSGTQRDDTRQTNTNVSTDNERQCG